MKTLAYTVLALSLSLPMAGCGGPDTGDTTAPENVPEQPTTDPFSGGGDDDEKGGSLEAPPLEAPTSSR